MPRTRSLAWAELKIGILTVFALVAAACSSSPSAARAASSGSATRSRPGSRTSRRCARGTPVRLAGIEVGAGHRGAVRRHRPSTPGSRCRRTSGTSITDRLDGGDRLASRCWAKAPSTSTPAPGGTPIPDWGYVTSSVAPGSIAALTESATAGLDRDEPAAGRPARRQGHARPAAHRRQRLPRDGRAHRRGQPGDQGRRVGPGQPGPPGARPRASTTNWRRRAPTSPPSPRASGPARAASGCS